MTISSPEREAKKVKIAVDRNPVETSFEKWACESALDKKSQCLDSAKTETTYCHEITWIYVGLMV